MFETHAIHRRPRQTAFLKEWQRPSSLKMHHYKKLNEVHETRFKHTVYYRRQKQQTFLQLFFAFV